MNDKTPLVLYQGGWGGSTRESGTIAVQCAQWSFPPPYAVQFMLVHYSRQALSFFLPGVLASFDDRLSPLEALSSARIPPSGVRGVHSIIQYPEHVAEVFYAHGEAEAERFVRERRLEAGSGGGEGDSSRLSGTVPFFDLRGREALPEGWPHVAC